MSRLLKILFVGVSLQSYYFYSVGMPFFSVASLFLLAGILFGVPKDFDFRVPKDASTGIAAAYALLFVWSWIGLLFYGDNADVKRLIAFGISIFAVFVAVALFKRVPLEDLVRTYLLVHVSFFGVQMLVYYTTGHVLDFLAPITGEEQRMFGGSFHFPLIDRFIRPAGLFQEPGTYATFVAPFVALFERWYDNSTFNRRLFWLALLSLFVSFSVFGMVFGVLIFLLSRNIRRRSRIVGFVVAMGLAGPVLYYRFVFLPTIGLDTGLGFRQTFVRESLNFLLTDPVGFVFGSNLLVLDPRASFVAAFNDVGLFFYFLHEAGPLLTLLALSTLAYLAFKVDRAARVAMLILLLSKHSLFAPFFPLTLVAIFWRHELGRVKIPYRPIIKPAPAYAHTAHHYRSQ